MAHVEKSATPSARRRAAAKSVPGPASGAAAKTAPFAYTLKGSDVAVLAKSVPAGVRVALVPSSPEAEARLKAWAPMRRVGRLVPAAADGTAKASPMGKADFEPDARSRALLRGAETVRADLKAAGGAFDLDQVRSLLNGVSRQRVLERVKEGTLLSVPGPSNRRRYPTLQFTQGGEVVAGLREVQDALPTRNPWAVLNFFVQPDDHLDGRKPMDVLKAGDVARVVAAAKGVGVQGG